MAGPRVTAYRAGSFGARQIHRPRLVAGACYAESYAMRSFKLPTSIQRFNSPVAWDNDMLCVLKRPALNLKLPFEFTASACVFWIALLPALKLML